MAIEARSRRLFIGNNESDTASLAVVTAEPGTTVLVKHMYVFNQGQASAGTNLQHAVPASGRSAVVYIDDIAAGALVEKDLELVLEEADELRWYFGGPQYAGAIAIYGSILRA